MRTTILHIGLIAVFAMNVLILSAQDFLLFNDCNLGEESIINDGDSSIVVDFLPQIKDDASILSASGFTYLSLTNLQQTSSQENIYSLIQTLENSGISTIIDYNLVGGAPLSSGNYIQAEEVDKAINLQTQFNINGLNINSKAGLNVESLAFFINTLFDQKQLPTFIQTWPPDPDDPFITSQWMSRIQHQMKPGALAKVRPRVMDSKLREAFRLASSNPSYDVRLIFEQSLRDASALLGKDLITFINHSSFQNQNGIIGDKDDPILDPLFAYVYVLTNNQLGIPGIYFPDYVKQDDSDISLQENIQRLIKANKQYIHHSTNIEYLNKKGTDKKSVYLSSSEGADASTTLVYQINGNNTLAGKANDPIGNKDVIVAINFADAPLKLVQEINATNIPAGEIFTDIFGGSFTFQMEVHEDESLGINNAILIDLPPKSFSIWVQGQNQLISSEAFEFSVQQYPEFSELSWAIPFEKDQQGYEIQRSLNGKPFEKIAWIEALEAEEGQASYLYLDEDIFEGEQLYYRIKSVDNDGKFEYSSVEFVETPLPPLTMKVLDQKETKSKALKLTGKPGVTKEIVVFNTKGEQVLAAQQELFSSPKIDTTEIDLSDLPNGVYILNYTTADNHTYTERIVKHD